jgi:hypothetical protein
MPGPCCTQGPCGTATSTRSATTSNTSWFHPDEVIAQNLVSVAKVPTQSLLTSIDAEPHPPARNTGDRRSSA